MGSLTAALSGSYIESAPGREAGGGADWWAPLPDSNIRSHEFLPSPLFFPRLKADARLPPGAKSPLAELVPGAPQEEGCPVCDVFIGKKGS